MISLPGGRKVPINTLKVCVTEPFIQINEIHYPVLANIARDFLAIQASSIPCERLFSMAGIVDTKRRNRLAPGTFSALQTVRAHRQMTRREAKKTV